MNSRKPFLLVALLLVGAVPAIPACAADGPAGAARLTLPAQAQAVEAGPSPITLRLQYTGEEAYNVAGGVRDGASYMNNVLAQLHVDSRALGWSGGKFVLEAFYENADSLNEQYVGAAQDPSVIDSGGVAMFRVYQAYYQQNFGGTSVLAGIYDLQTEFGATRPMDIFFDGAYAWTTTLDQSGLNGPSTYPDTSLAIRIRQKITDHWSVQAAVLDGTPDSLKHPAANAVNLNRTAGALLIAEVDYTPTRTTKLLAGYWQYTGQFSSLSRVTDDGAPSLVYGSRGGYLGGATRLYSVTARRGLDVFANIGFAASDTQQIDRSYSAGLVYTGLFDSRPSDRLGFAVGVARAGGPYQQLQAAAGAAARIYETNFELTYRARLTDWLTVQPDIQYWINPNMDPALKNDLLLLLHFEVSHVFGL